MDCDGRKRDVRQAGGPPQRRTPSSIINPPLSIINSHGFTLIELLVVIAVIAVLMAVLLPVLGRVRKQTRAVVCRSNLRQWGQILATYTAENDGRLGCESHSMITAAWLFRGAAPFDETDVTSRPLSLSADTQGIRCCPTAARHVFDGIGGVGTANLYVRFIDAFATFQAWQVLSPSPGFRGSYGFNEWLVSGRFNLTNPTNIPHYVNLSNIRGPTDDIPVLLDATRLTASPRSGDSPPGEEDTNPRSEMARFCMNRHDGYVNGLFLDWSVRRVGLKELWTLRWYERFDTAGRWTKAGNAQPEDWPEWMRGFKDY